MEDFLYRRSNVLHVCDSISHSIGSILWRGLDSGYFLIRLTVQTEPTNVLTLTLRQQHYIPSMITDSVSVTCFLIKYDLQLNSIEIQSKYSEDQVVAFDGACASVVDRCRSCTRVHGDNP